MILLLLAACGSDSKLDRVNDAPTAIIDAPLEGEVFREGAGLVGLRGRVADTYDDPPDLTVSWVVDEAAPVAVTPDAEGAVTLDLADLALGEHTARLDVLDTDGDAGTASVRFVVAGPLGPPTVEITDPEDGHTVTIGTSIPFAGVASDVSTDADRLEFAWSSSIDGPLEGAVTADGRSVLITSALTVGDHAIRLDVTDEDAEVGSDTIQVIVTDEPVEPEPGDLIFSEVMVNPNAVVDEDGEWAELYNTSGYTLDVNGYSFHDDGSDEWVFDAPLEVGPHGYIVLCANADPSRNGGIACDGWFYRNPLGERPSTGFGSGIAIANNDDELVLTSPDGVDIDVFDYDDTDSDPIQAGMSFGLDPDRMDGTSNDDVDNWCVQTTVLSGAIDPGTPGLENDDCGEE